MRRSFGAVALAAAGVLTGVFGCQSIADIPEVSYSAICKEYCDTEFSVCPSTDGQYQDYPTCMQVCDVLDKKALGSTADAANTIQCRLNRLADAASTAGSDRTDLCASAGPGGGTLCTRTQTGADCEGYCTLYNAACNGDSHNPFHSKDLGDDKSGDLNSCMVKCTAIQPPTHTGSVPTPGYDWNSGKTSMDTLGCRLYYVSAAVVDPAANCDMAGIRPSGQCLGPGEPDCVDFCRALGVACPTDALKVYENDVQCQAVCNATEKGTKQDTMQVDTIGCRTAHVFNALLIDPKTHCPHVSPLGAGVCGTSDTAPSPVGGNCEAFCRLANDACPDDFPSYYADEDDCREKCASIPRADQPYSVKVAKQGGDNLQCRTLWVSRVIESLAAPDVKLDAAACKSVFGGGDCSN